MARRVKHVPGTVSSNRGSKDREAGDSAGVRSLMGQPGGLAANDSMDRFVAKVERDTSRTEARLTPHDDAYTLSNGSKQKEATGGPVDALCMNKTCYPTR